MALVMKINVDHVGVVDILSFNFLQCKLNILLLVLLNQTMVRGKDAAQSAIILSPLLREDEQPHVTVYTLPHLLLLSMSVQNLTVVKNINN